MQEENKQRCINRIQTLKNNGQLDNEKNDTLNMLNDFYKYFDEVIAQINKLRESYEKIGTELSNGNVDKITTILEGLAINRYRAVMMIEQYKESGFSSFGYNIGGPLLDINALNTTLTEYIDSKNK